MSDNIYRRVSIYATKDADEKSEIVYWLNTAPYWVSEKRYWDSVQGIVTPCLSRFFDAEEIEALEPGGMIEKKLGVVE